MNKSSIQFLHKQLKKSFNPLNDIKRLQVLTLQELNNTISRIEKGASCAEVVDDLKELSSNLDQVASKSISLELFLRSMKHPIQEYLGERVNKHD